jgi:hypothetical protein
VDVAQAHSIVAAAARDDAGAFYGSSAGLTLGAGLILSNVEFPAYQPDEDRFIVWAGPVLILSHECDLDQNNQRLLNDLAIICPVRQLEALVEMAGQAGYSDNALTTFLGNLASRRVSRAVYFPPFPDALPHGGFIYLNQFTHTSVKRLSAEGSEKIGALSAYAMQSVDYVLKEHLFREKADRLPLHSAAMRRSISITTTK